MSVLDELREQIQSGTTWRNSSWKQWKDEVLAIIDAFAEAHPKLVDMTSRCDFCGSPLPADEDGEVDWETVPVLAYDDGSPMYGCPACAKETTNG